MLARLLIGLGALIIAFGGGWKVNDWRRDSRENAALKKAATALKAASDRLYSAAGQFEQERTDETCASIIRQTELRTIYRDIPVRSDCAAPDAAGRVLDDAIARANARAAGQPLGPVRPSAEPASAPR